MAVIMAKDEHTSKCSNSSSGGGGGDGGSGNRSAKKLKHKKVPQRGLGVAQLEKIISEQRQKNQNQNENQSLGGLGYESSPPTWTPAPNLMLQRSQHLQPPCPSPMVNVSAGTSLSPSSSVLNYQMEPPSNQSYYGNNYRALWSGEEKMVGMKRPYPFSLENRPMSSLYYKFPSAFCSNGGITNIEHAHLSFSENPSSLSAKSDLTTMKFIDENQVLTRDFIKLAPSQASQINSSSKEKLYLSPQKEQSEDPSHLSGRGGSNLPPFLGFFPAARTHMEQLDNNSGEAGESVDLNLKL